MKGCGCPADAEPDGSAFHEGNVAVIVAAWESEGGGGRDSPLVESGAYHPLHGREVAVGGIFREVADGDPRRGVESA